MALLGLLALLEDHANGMIRRERVFRDHNDLLAHDDDWLMSRFRFPRAMLLDLCAHRNHAIPVQTQVLTILGFLATGCFQREWEDR